MPNNYFFPVLILSLVLFQSNAISNSNDLSRQRSLFLSAERALASNNFDTYQGLKNQLRTYTLYPYLEYAEVRKDLSHELRIQHFIDTHPDTALSERLKKTWLTRLGKDQRWQKFLQVYTPSENTELQCYHLNARLSQKVTAEKLDEGMALWLVGKSQPNACDPVFSYLEQYGKIGREALWQRIDLAMGKSKVGLVNYLSNKLPPNDKIWAKRLIEAHNKPASTLESAKKWADNYFSRKVIAHAIQRLARKNVSDAWYTWNKQFLPRFNFDPTLADKVEAAIATRAARKHMPAANTWFKQIDDGTMLDETSRVWRIRSALREQDWPAVISAIHDLPGEVQDEDEWVYWLARAYEENRQHDKARLLFEQLANKTSYHGFLAAEQLNQDYTIRSEPVVDSQSTSAVKHLGQQPGFQRARELYAIGRNVDAYREWRHEVGKLDIEGKKLAARLAHDWGWHFAAIATTAKARHFSDLDLRFPIIYRQQVQQAAKNNYLPDSYIYGIMRRESAFRENAISPAGAQGLMQLMPATANMVRKRLNMPKLSRADIRDVDINIRLGANYLREVLDIYNDHEILATASYNAGPGRVKQWLPKDYTMPADIWVETIVFNETRKYVKAVMFYSTIFDWKLDNRINHKLKNRMRPVYRKDGTRPLAAKNQKPTG